MLTQLADTGASLLELYLGPIVASRVCYSSRFLDLREIQRRLFAG